MVLNTSEGPEQKLYFLEMPNFWHCNQGLSMDNVTEITESTVIKIRIGYIGKVCAH